MPSIQGFEWLIIVALIALLFGAKKLPDAARGLGRSLRIFKAETKGLIGDDAASPPQAITEGTPPPPPPPLTVSPTTVLPNEGVLPNEAVPAIAEPTAATSVPDNSTRTSIL